MSSESAEKLLMWAKNRPDIFNRPLIRSIPLSNRTLLRTTVEIQRNYFDSKDIIAGTGRSDLASESLLKAYAEAIERIAMIQFKRGMIFDIFKINTTTTDLELASCSSVPPKEIITSNGWAVHFNREKAILNALSEAFERHILQYSFLKDGWRGFSRVKEEKVDLFQCQFMRSMFTCSGFEAGLVAAKSNIHPGHTFGFFSSTHRENENSHWEHAQLEAIEPLYFYDGKSTQEIINLEKRTKDFLEKSQLAMLLNGASRVDIAHLETEDFKPTRIELHGDSYICVKNVRDFFEMPFDFYAAFAFNPSFIGLFKKDLSSFEARTWVKKSYSLNGFSKRDSYETPVY